MRKTFLNALIVVALSVVSATGQCPYSFATSFAPNGPGPIIDVVAIAGGPAPGLYVERNNFSCCSTTILRYADGP